VRELAAAALLLLALAVGALAPKLWPDDTGGSALASGRPAATGPLATVASTAFAPVSWKAKDGGAGFVVCGAADSWSRPSLAEQNAQLASGPRFAAMRADDQSSEAWAPFRANAVFYDGSSIGMRIDLVALTGLWTDPYIGGNAVGCTSTEPQVWLFGYAPTKYHSDDRDFAYLDVVPAPGYRMVILTGTIRPRLVVAASVKLAVLEMPTKQIAPTPTPAPKPTEPAAYTPRSITDPPRELILPDGCRILAASAHQDDLGATWTVQCGSARANLSVVVAALKQGWTHLAGPPIGVGLQNYEKGKLTMQLAYRLDGPAYSDSFQLVQYWRPYSAGGPGAANPLAYLRVPTGFQLLTGCEWREAPAGFTEDGAYKLPFACPGLKPDQIQAAFTRALEAQGWHIDNRGFGFQSYAKDDLRLTAGFASSETERSRTPWVVEALCCFGR
jgi:hypothetical protein